MKTDLVERLQYITLLFVFLAVAIAVYVLFSFGSKLDRQLQIAMQQSKTQQQTIDQLQRSVNDLKADNQLQTEYIQCLLTAHDLGGFSESCSPGGGITPHSSQPVAAPISSTPVNGQAIQGPKGDKGDPGPPANEHSVIPGKNGCTLKLVGVCV